MAGLFFWRKKREAPAAPQEELSSFESSADTLVETTAGAELPETSTAVEEPKPAAKVEKPRLFKPKAKPKAEEPEVEVSAEAVVEDVEEPQAEPAPEPEPEPVVETAAESEPEAPEVHAEEPVVADEPVVAAEASALPVEELPSYGSSEEALAETTTGVDDLEPEFELEQVELPKRSFAKGIKSLFTRIKFDIENLDDLEDTLIQADFGVDAAAQIVDGVKQRAKKAGAKTEAELKQILEDLIAETLEREDKQLNLADGKLPYVILVVGVNGV
ncbi:MAG: hypothetical protein RL149_311, partial [Actinomycetota bacterium]